jgi:RND superfamily putative drug exporter
MFHDLNRRSSSDLLRAEALGVPLTVIVLFLVFRTATAAGIAIGAAVSAVTLTNAFLFVLNGTLPVSVLAQNVVTMIGLGAGTDYALFILSHYRAECRQGRSIPDAVQTGVSAAAPAIITAGLAVAGGFAALFLVNARFVHSLAAGGIVVIGCAVAVALTLLPALLTLLGDRVLPRRSLRTSSAGTPVGRGWIRWTSAVMQRPWGFLLLALAISAACAWPARRVHAWRITASDLPPEEEATRGAAILADQFQPGWTGPIVVLLEAKDGHSLWEPSAQRAALALADQLSREPSIAHVLGYTALLETLGPTREAIAGTSQLPPPLTSTARSVISADGRTARIIAVPNLTPEARVVVELVTRLRAQAKFAADRGPLSFRVGGGTAIVSDFDDEMFHSVTRVMAAVVVLTFVLMLVAFRSIAVPLKAIAANFLSVFAAYGFLVLLFQDGIGAQALGIAPPGGLNSFVVLMLFTILFGLSMDYEIFLLSRIRAEFDRTSDNETSVANGLAHTAGIITSAAAVMICLFGSFGFFGLTATRQFGLGLAFAVAFDATIVRLLLVPVTMRLLGRWNWWLPLVATSRPSQDSSGSAQFKNGLNLNGNITR